MTISNKRRNDIYFLIFRFFFALILIPGVYYLQIAGGMLKYNYNLFRSGIRVNANVAGMGVYQANSPGRTGTVEQHTYLFRFADINGIDVEVNSAHGYNSHFEPYNDDGTMPIIYNPSDPKQNRINSFGRMWLLPVLQMILGLVMSFAGLIMIIPMSLVKKMKGKS